MITLLKKYRKKEKGMGKNKQMRPFGWRDKVGYMFGDFGNDFTFIFASLYLMVFYTKVLGVSADSGCYGLP